LTKFDALSSDVIARSHALLCPDRRDDQISSQRRASASPVVSQQEAKGFDRPGADPCPDDWLQLRHAMGIHPAHSGASKVNTGA
jgi:hypothetical protein